MVSFMKLRETLRRSLPPAMSCFIIIMSSTACASKLAERIAEQANETQSETASEAEPKDEGTLTSAPNETARLRSGLHELTMKFGGLERLYLVYVPASLGSSPAVVINLHGGGGNAEQAEDGTKMNETADRHGFVVVYPEGLATERGLLGAKKKMATWNAGECCAASVEQNIDDVGFISAVIDQVVAKTGADARRVFATGFSNGGMMAIRLACELSEKIAAISPIAGVGVYHSCDPKEPVPTLLINGTADRCVPYEGGQGGDCYGIFLSTLLGREIKVSGTDQITMKAIPDFVAEWNALHGVGPETTELAPRGRAHCTSYGDGTQRSETVLCRVEGMGHTWPGGAPSPLCKRPSSRMCRSWIGTVGRVEQSFSANELMWQFFERHGK